MAMIWHAVLRPAAARPAGGTGKRTPRGSEGGAARTAAPIRLVALILLALLAAPALAPAAHARLSESKLTKEQKKVLAQLPPQYRAWLDEVEVLITKEERRAFLDLKEDYQRDAFIERFWEVRDRGGAPGDFRRSWEARIQEARTLFGRLSDERARVYLLNGPPAARIAERCNVLLWPVEAWFYHGSERLGMDFVVVFYQVWGAGQFRMWEPAAGIAE
ncbi:MAG: GWxTD domain-containing protein, partial [Acidobacteria bacterium]|nr:GWxTD domain-containing protein [Acidobacteriota bacterium]